MSFSLYLKAGENERELASNILQIWEDLSYQAKEVDASLVAVKKTFTEVCDFLSL